MKGLLEPTYDQLTEAMVDITKPGMPVEVKFNADRTVLWVNVGPVCVLRICRIEDGKVFFDKL